MRVGGLRVVDVADAVGLGAALDYMRSVGFVGIAAHEADRLAALDALEQAEVGAGEQADVVGVLAVDALEAFGDHQAHAGALQHSQRRDQIMPGFRGARVLEPRHQRGPGGAVGEALDTLGTLTRRRFRLATVTVDHQRAGKVQNDLRATGREVRDVRYDEAVTIEIGRPAARAAARSSAASAALARPGLSTSSIFAAALSCWISRASLACSRTRFL